MYLAITKTQAEAIAALIKTMDAKANARTDYTGRGMFDLTCTGFVTSVPAYVIPAIIKVLSDEGIEFDAFALAAEQRIDNMGHDFIAYFPAIHTKG